jgi:hypothetical protein
LKAIEIHLVSGLFYFLQLSDVARSQNYETDQGPQLLVLASAVASSMLVVTNLVLEVFLVITLTIV